MTVPPGGQQGATAECPPDTIAIGGAYNGGRFVNIYTSIFEGDPNFGIPPTGWFVGAFNTGSDYHDVAVFAICAPVIS